MTQILFIDARVTDFNSLINTAGNDVEIVMLDTEQDGLQQIVAALAGRGGLDAVHIVSHGAAGTLLLGSTVLSSDNLDSYQAELGAVGLHLADSGDLLLYGCNVGQGGAGQRFIDDLARLSGADVTASTDISGAVAVGGNSTLEALSGAIETATLSIDGLAALAVITGSGANDSLSGTSGSDTIVGGAGDDTLRSNGGSDSLDGGSGNDLIDAGFYQGNTTVRGGDGSDYLLLSRDYYYGSGATLIADGGAGDDVFELGPTGSNVIKATGGTGADVFKIASGSNASSTVVTDFKAGAGGDLIDLTSLIDSDGRGGNPFGNGLVKLVQQGVDTVLQYKPAAAMQYLVVLTLAGVKATSLTAANFIDGVSPDGATMRGIDAMGGAGDDNLQGGRYDDTLTGGSGRDLLNGGSGNDLLDGGAGDDTVQGGGGNDTALGGAGNDYLITSSGDDSLAGGDGDDSLTANTGSGNSVLDGGNGNDRFDIGYGYSSGTAAVKLRIVGGAGDDIVRMNSSDATLQVEASGGAGVDTYAAYDTYNAVLTVTDFAVGAGGDKIDVSALVNRAVSSYGAMGGNPFGAEDGVLRLVQQGADTLVQIDSNGAAGGISFITVLRLSNVLASTLTSANFVDGYKPDGSRMPGLDLHSSGYFSSTHFDDTLIGSSGWDMINGQGGNDYLDGAGGDDDLRAGRGHDTLLGGAGNDMLTNSGDAVTMDGGDGNDNLSVDVRDTTSAYVVRGGAGDDRIALSSYSYAPPDSVGVVDGGVGNDTIELTMSGQQAGNWTISGGAGSDTFVIASAPAAGVAISDFTAGAGGDLIDVSRLLSYAWDYNNIGGNPFTSMMRLLQAGADTLLQYQSYNNPGVFITILTLANVTASTLTSANFVNGYSPDGAAIAGKLLTATGDGGALYGQSLNDTLVGSSAGEVLYGYGGDDLLQAHTPAGSNKASLVGGGGNDTLLGGAGDDALDGDNQSSALRDSDLLDGGAGNDTLTSVLGSDTLRGGDGDDLLSVWTVGTGADVVVLDGGAGNDVFNLSSSFANRSVSASGGAGTDTYVIGYYYGHEFYQAPNLRITDFKGGAGGDLIDLSGSPLLSGWTPQAPDLLSGDSDCWRLVQDGDNVLLQWDVDGAASYTSFDTVITFEHLTVAEITAANFVSRLVSATEGGYYPSIMGDSGNDTLSGNSQDNLIDGGGGVDLMSGGAGNDSYTVSEAQDQVIELANQGNDSVLAKVDYTLGANLEQLQLAGHATTGIGNSANNILIANAGRDSKLYGMEGDDRLSGAAGNDTLAGGAGNDTLDGGAGNDQLQGGVGDDQVRGGDGADLLVLMDKLDNYEGVLSGGGALELRNVATGEHVTVADVELFRFSDGDYTLAQLRQRYPQPDSELRGSAGADTLEGGPGRDTLVGEGGNDVYIVRSAATVVLELANGGVDRVDTALGQYALGDNLENLRHTGAGDFTGSGNALANLIEGAGGNDLLQGGGGNDTLRAGTGHDTIDGGAGADRVGVLGNVADYTVSRASQSDTLLENTATGEHLLIRNVETLVFLDGDRTVAQLTESLSSPGNDVLTDSQGRDYLDGGAGADTMSGGLGDDVYVVDTAQDVVVEQVGQGVDTVRIAFGEAGAYVLAANVEHAVVVTPYAITLTGNALDNSLQGNAGADVLNGGAGNDTLEGMGGADVLAGGSGNDSYRVTVAGVVVNEAAAQGTDTVITTLATYTLAANLENLQYQGGSGFAGTGNELANVIHGGGGDDTLSGGAGNDSIAGGLGSDSVDGGAGQDTVYLAGNFADWTRSRSSATVTVLSNAHAGVDASDGTPVAATVTLFNVEYVFFGDGLRTIAEVQANLTSDANDKLTGGAGDDVLDGAAGADSLVGLDGNDTLNGGSGNDSMTGGGGDDVYLVDALGDVVTEAANGGVDTVRTGLASYTLGANLEHLTYTGAATFTGNGNALANALHGGEAGARLDGAAGDDTLTGGAGDDSLLGGDGNDALRTAGGVDVADGGAGSDVLTVLGNFNDYTRSRPSATDLLLVNLVTGERITVRNIESIVFADGAKTLTEAQVNLPGAGNDLLIGGGGNDTLSGGAGSDSMRGGAGDDLYLIDVATDVVTELVAEGVDTVNVGFATAATYVMTANLENATLTVAGVAAGITGNELDNVLTGNTAANALSGGAGNDTLDGGAGSDKLTGGSGDDVYLVADAGDVVIELAAEGVDTVKTTVATLVLAANVENLVYTGAAAFTGTGNALDNIITGGNKGAKLDGGAGNDSLSGGAGNDSLQGGSGDDTLVGGAGKDTIDGGLGNDVLKLAGDFASYTVTRPTALDTVLTDTNGNVLTLRGVETLAFADGSRTLAEVQDNVGSPGNDKLHGTVGDDLLNGGLGVDTLTGGSGDDTYVIANSATSVVEGDGGGTDLVEVALTAASTYVLAANVENAKVTAAAAIAVNLTGNELNNYLTGNAAVNILTGGAGNDTLDGGAGADKLSGGSGDDIYVVDLAGDVITEAVGGGVDGVKTALATYALSANVENLTYTGAAAFTGTGNALDNVIAGGNGGAKLDGGAGSDTLEGGAGNDSLVGGAGDDELRGSAGSDILDGGAGYDGARMSGMIGDYVIMRPNATDTVLTDHAGNVTTLRNVEYLYFADTDLPVNQLTDNVATVGNDALHGTSGNDTINGLAGNDSMSGGLGDDLYIVSAAGDVIVEHADEGVDQVNVGFTAAGTYALAGHLENATVTAAAGIAVNLTGNELANVLTGNAAANTLVGNAGDDTLNGGAGNDSLVGGEGDDAYVVDAAGDKVVESADNGSDRVDTSLASYTLTANVESLRYTGTAAFTGTGNELDNTIKSGAGNDVLNGGAGNDVLSGGAGSDKLTGGAGADLFVLDSQAGSDTITDFVSGTDHLGLNLAALAIGNGDMALDGAMLRAAPGGFGADAELVLFSQKMTSASTANAAAVIGTATGAYAVGDSALFAVSTATATTLYRFTSSGADAVVSAGELTQLVTLTGAPNTVLADYSLADYLG
jgi:Ca2+-binding RTX toxin-like protein